MLLHMSSFRTIVRRECKHLLRTNQQLMPPLLVQLMQPPNMGGERASDQERCTSLGCRVLSASWRCVLVRQGQQVFAYFSLLVLVKMEEMERRRSGRTCLEVQPNTLRHRARHEVLRGKGSIYHTM